MKFDHKVRIKSGSFQSMAMTEMRIRRSANKTVVRLNECAMNRIFAPFKKMTNNEEISNSNVLWWNIIIIPKFENSVSG